MPDENQAAFIRFADQANPYYDIAINIPSRYLINLVMSDDLTEKAYWAQARAEVRVANGRKLSTDYPLETVFESVGMVLTPIKNPLGTDQYALAASDGTTAIIYDRSTFSCDESGNVIAHPLYELSAHQSAARTIRDFIQQHGVNTEIVPST